MPLGAPRGAHARDPRIEEMRDMGLPRVWQSVAEELGYDVWLRLWRILDEDQTVFDDRHRVRVPCYSRYQRFQRDQIIRRMRREGVGPVQIRNYVTKTLGEDITTRQVSRVALTA